MKRTSFKKMFCRAVGVFVVVSFVMSAAVTTLYARPNPVSVTIGSVKGEPGSEVTLDIKFSDIPEKGLTSAQFDVNYDKSKLTFVSLKSGAIVHNPMFDVSYNSGDEIKNGLAIIYADYDQSGDSQIKSNGVFCSIKFKINSNCPSSYQTVSLSPTYTVNAVGEKKENLFYSEITVPTLTTYGQGVVTVGDPKPVIKLKVGDTKIDVNGDVKEIDSSPQIISGRTLLPIRAVVEALGGTIEWQASDKKITINLKGSKKIEMWISNKKVNVNGSSQTIDVPPQIIKERTYVPVRFVSENGGCKVDWDADTKTVTISQ